MEINLKRVPKGSCAKRAIARLGTYEEDGIIYSFLVPIKSRGAGDKGLFKLIEQTNKVFLSKNAIKSGVVTDAKQKEQFYKDFPEYNRELMVRFVEYDFTHSSHLEQSHDATVELMFRNIINALDMDRKCFNGENLWSVASAQNIEKGKPMIAEGDYTALIEWLKSKELSNEEIGLFNLEFETMIKGAKTLGQIDFEQMAKENGNKE